jgi:hypothetical protein
MSPAPCNIQPSIKHHRSVCVCSPAEQLWEACKDGNLDDVKAVVNNMPQDQRAGLLNQGDPTDDVCGGTLLNHLVADERCDVHRMMPLCTTQHGGVTPPWSATSLRWAQRWTCTMGYDPDFNMMFGLRAVSCVKMC